MFLIFSYIVTLYFLYFWLTVFIKAIRVGYEEYIRKIIIKKKIYLKKLNICTNYLDEDISDTDSDISEKPYTILQKDFPKYYNK